MLLVALSLQACTSNNKPASFKVERDKTDRPALSDVANFDVTVDGSLRDARLLDAAAAAARQVGEQLNSGTLRNDGPVRTLHLVVRAPGVEVKDKSVGSKIVHLTYDAKTLQQAVRFGADEDTVLASADDVGWWTPTNDDVVHDYCDGRSDGHFCNKFLER